MPVTPAPRFLLTTANRVLLEQIQLRWETKAIAFFGLRRDA
jgi:hypothetical protein